MALGFNNAPVDWRQDYSQDRSGELLARGIQQVGQAAAAGIQEYYARQREKEAQKQATQLLMKHGQSFGLPPEMLKDEKAVGAAVKTIGPDKLLGLGQAVQEYQQREREMEQRAAMERERLAQAREEALMQYRARMAPDPDADLKRQLTAAQIEETKARTEKTKKDTAKVEKEPPIGQVVELPELPGYKLVRTSEGSSQLVPPQESLTVEDKVRITSSVAKEQIEKYIKKTRNPDGTIKDGWWPGSGDKVELNPDMERYLQLIGYPGAQGPAQPAQPAPAQPGQAAGPDWLSGIQ